jgi:hypothetical protein
MIKKYLNQERNECQKVKIKTGHVKFLPPPPTPFQKLLA